MSIQVAVKGTPSRHDIIRAAEQPNAPLHLLREVIEHAAHLLPAQGPITVFIHHNTLHAFEEMTFDEAVREGARVFGCQPYLTEDRFREALGRGRIRFRELRDVLKEDLGDRGAEAVPPSGTRLDLRLAMLQYPLRHGPAEELGWFVEETDALRKVRPEVSAAVRGRLLAETRRWVMRDLRSNYEASRKGMAGRSDRKVPDWLPTLFDRFHETSIETWDEEVWESFTLQALWHICRAGVRAVSDPQQAPPPAVRHRDLILQATGTDIDPWIHAVLVRFCAAFLDQGFGQWPLPNRELGFYEAFRTLYQQPGGPPDRWLYGLSRELRRLTRSNLGALESIRESLSILGVPQHEWKEYLSNTLLALRGWGGMVREIELRGDRVAHPAPKDSLIEFLAVRLILERFAVAYAARDRLNYRGPLQGLGEEARRHIQRVSPSSEPRAFVIFQLAQVQGWTPDELYHLRPEQWTKLIAEIESFSELERRRIFHLAYEQRFYIQALDAFGLHAPYVPPTNKAPRFQVVTCLDEREESFRRHLEEIAPDVETFGAAGFYGVAMYYRGAADAHFVPLCPIIIKPKHWVEEQVLDAREQEHRRRAFTRKALGTASLRFHTGSRTFALGALLTATVGVLASIPLVARILFPRLTARIRRRFGALVQTPPETRLKLERKTPEPGDQNGSLGYSVTEMTDIAERQLRDIGLTRRFARLVFILGHGSNSLNNPHKSAYDCGACGGSPGAPNGRAIAQILNDTRVRANLVQRGLHVPDTTFFVGGFHNTCNDTVTLFDLDRIPDSHRDEFLAAQHDLEQTCARNAHERCRRFMSAPLTLSFEDARAHVEARSEDLAQTRPELGHATNAICFVGRRARTRGVYFDRRAFLTSYDPTQDDVDQNILFRILQAAIPVCAGINLEYYFSRVDSTGWGCGSKLPHNLTALLGVMDGAASDLRTGLPWQMVEIHEPVRLLFVIETSAAAMLRIMDRSEVIGRLCRNGWVQIVVLDPDSSALQIYRNGTFEDYRPQATQLPKVASSLDWYRGWRDHLEFAEIES